MDDMLTMLKDLTDAPGPSGFEAPVRHVMHRYLEPYGEIMSDRLGSIAARKVGLEGGPTILIAGHLDEIGFMVTRITDEGYLKFQPIGGWWDQVMLAQRVDVITREGRIPGLIGSKPPHILAPEERNKMYEKKHMFIDIGASSRDEVLAWGINPGDPIVPACPFTVMHNPNMLMAKAWDNRFGCALVVEVLRRLASTAHPNIVYGAATVQEEVGLRGATTIANIVQPDIAFALDTGIAGDTPGISPDDVEGQLGKGPVALIYDGSMIPHVGLRDLVIDTARAEGIPLQFDKMAGGGTDAGKFHVAGAGAPSLVLGVAVRYIHTNAAIMHRGDFEQAADLLTAIIKRLDADTVSELTA